MPEMDRASYVCFGPKYSLFLQMSRELRDLHNQKTQPGNTNHFTGVTSNEQLTKYFRARLVRSLYTKVILALGAMHICTGVVALFSSCIEFHYFFSASGLEIQFGLILPYHLVFLVV